MLRCVRVYCYSYLFTIIVSLIIIIKRITHEALCIEELVTDVEKVLTSVVYFLYIFV